MTLENVLKKSRMHELSMAQMFMARNIGSFHQGALKEYGLSSIQWLVLGVIADSTARGGIRVTDLATSFDVKTTYITSVLNSLRAKKYVETRYDPQDARVRLAIITATGAEQIISIESHMQKEIARMLNGVISAQELEQYIQTLQKLTATR
jgi:DNA-binding MarR family transcriptional regulator